MIAKNSSAAVGAKSLMAAMMAPVTPPSTSSAIPVPVAIRPIVIGTRISAMTGVIRLLRIKYMKAAIITTPSAMSIGAPFGKSLVNEP